VVPGEVVATYAAGVLPIPRNLRNLDIHVRRVDIDLANVPVEVPGPRAGVHHVSAEVSYPSPRF
jgi:hypothetical protein